MGSEALLSENEDSKVTLEIKDSKSKARLAEVINQKIKQYDGKVSVCYSLEDCNKIKQQKVGC